MVTTRSLGEMDYNADSDFAHLQDSHYLLYYNGFSVCQHLIYKLVQLFC